MIDELGRAFDRRGSEPERGVCADARADQREEQHGRNHPLAGDAGGAHGDDFTIGGHAAEAYEDADQDAEGDGVREHAGQRECEELEHDARVRGVGANEKLEDGIGAFEEQDERGEQGAEDGAGEDLAEDVAA